MKVLEIEKNGNGFSTINFNPELVIPYLDDFVEKYNVVRLDRFLETDPDIDNYFEFYTEFVLYFMGNIFEEKGEFYEEFLNNAFLSGNSNFPQHINTISEELLLEYIDVIFFILSFRIFLLKVADKLKIRCLNLTNLNFNYSFTHTGKNESLVHSFLKNHVNLVSIQRAFAPRKIHKDYKDFSMEEFLIRASFALNVSFTRLVVDLLTFKNVEEELNVKFLSEFSIVVDNSNIHENSSLVCDRVNRLFSEKLNIIDRDFKPLNI